MFDIHKFRILGVAEGTSYLLLLFIATPMKWFGGVEMPVKILGPIHGFLFLAYCFHAILIWRSHKWPVIRLGLAWISSVLPFGTFIFDKKYLATAEEAAPAHRNSL